MGPPPPGPCGLSHWGGGRRGRGRALLGLWGLQPVSAAWDLQAAEGSGSRAGAGAVAAATRAGLRWGGQRAASEGRQRAGASLGFRRHLPVLP